MPSRLRAALAALLAVAALSASVAGAPGAPPLGVAEAQSSPDDAADHDRTVIHVKLHGDGGATWSVTTRLDVSSEAEREALRTIARRYERGTRPSPWLDELRTVNDAAEAATGRPMRITNVSRSSDVRNGTLTLRAHWTNFSRRDGKFLVARDAFNTTHGTWLDGLSESQVLVVELPASPVVRNSPKAVRNGQMRWEGPHDFEAGRPYVEFRESSGFTDPSYPIFDVLTAGLVVGVVAVGVYVLSHRRDRLPSPTASGSDAETAGEDAGSTASADSSTAGGTETAAKSGAATRTATTGTVEPSPEEPATDVDEELLSDEERVERLLDRNGGRMKQATIVKETGWSNAKVSQLLSSMADEDRIDKLRIGRENLISFPDEDVADVDDR